MLSAPLKRSSVSPNQYVFNYNSRTGLVLRLVLEDRLALNARLKPNQVQACFFAAERTNRFQDLAWPGNTRQATERVCIWPGSTRQRRTTTQWRTTFEKESGVPLLHISSIQLHTGLCAHHREHECLLLSLPTTHRHLGARSVLQPPPRPQLLQLLRHQ